MEIINSPRIDYCGACKKEHGYDCPKDKPMKNEHAQSLGKSSWEKRTKGMTKEQISDMMKKLQKPKRKKIQK